MLQPRDRHVRRQRRDDGGRADHGLLDRDTALEGASPVRWNPLHAVSVFLDVFSVVTYVFVFFSVI